MCSEQVFPFRTLYQAFGEMFGRYGDVNSVMKGKKLTCHAHIFRLTSNHLLPLLSLPLSMHLCIYRSLYGQKHPERGHTMYTRCKSGLACALAKATRRFKVVLDHFAHEERCTKTRVCFGSLYTAKVKKAFRTFLYILCTSLKHPPFKNAFPLHASPSTHSSGHCPGLLAPGQRSGAKIPLYNALQMHATSQFRSDSCMPICTESDHTSVKLARASRRLLFLRRL